MVKLFHHIGKYFLLLSQIFTRPEKPSMYRKEIFRQMNDIGVGSFIIIALVATFIGAVTAIQFIYQLEDSFLPLYWIGYIVRDAMIIELAPTISCLILAGKVGSNVASEIGGMRMKEQIDALDVMGVNTPAYLIRPKIIAAVIMIPCLIIFAAFLGVTGGYFASTSTGILTPQDYSYGVKIFFKEYFVFMMMVKSFVFAFLIVTISAYQGYYVKGGAIELGAASTRAVVMSNIAILLADYVIAAILT